jgi:hypothetical protein
MSFTGLVGTGLLVAALSTGTGQIGNTIDVTDLVQPEEAAVELVCEDDCK